MGGPINNVHYGTGHQILHLPALRKCYAQKRPRPPPLPHDRPDPPPRWGLFLLAHLFQRQKAPHLLMSDPQASEPANEPAEPDPRAAMKAHLYQMAQSAFELQLHREFPKYKTMLKGWDGQQFFWQKANKPAMAEHFGVTMGDLRAEWDAAKRLFHKNRAADISRDRTNATLTCRRFRSSCGRSRCR